MVRSKSRYSTQNSQECLFLLPFFSRKTTPDYEHNEVEAVPEGKLAVL